MLWTALHRHVECQMSVGAARLPRFGRARSSWRGDAQCPHLTGLKLALDIGYQLETRLDVAANMSCHQVASGTKRHMRERLKHPARSNVVVMPVSNDRMANGIPNVRCLDRWRPVSPLQRWERTTAR